MPKHIVFCADGTWNGPGRDDDVLQGPPCTNVYKLFLNLAGAADTASLCAADEQEKSATENGQVVQTAKYIHGVGDSRNPMVKLMGGALGAGTITRIVRGYTFISRNYEAGDAIVILGFSRGAYTARALAGLIVTQGLLAAALTTDRTAAYRYGANAWYRYRQRMTADKPSVLARLMDAVTDLPAFVSQDTLRDSDLVPVSTIRAVGVWDTVGALGIPLYRNDARYDAFRFTDTKLSAKVQFGFHAVSLDEQRIDFTPTLWDAAANVAQMLFPGAHADVGGGYPAGAESGLSDIALSWMSDQLRPAQVGVRFGTPVYVSAPNPCGPGHEPWRHPPFNLPGTWKPREFRRMGIPGHQAIKARMDGGAVVADAAQPAAPYAPTNWP